MPLLQGLADQLRGPRVAMLAGLSAAYLFYFYAGVYLELSKPPALVVFIGQQTVGI